MPPDFNRTRQQDEFDLRKKFCDHDTHDRDRAQRLFYPAPGRLLRWRLVLLGLFGLNIYVLHFRNVHGVYVKRQFSSGSAVPPDKSAVECVQRDALAVFGFSSAVGKTAASAPFHVFFPHGDAGMAVMLFLFVLIVLYHWTPE